MFGLTWKLYLRILLTCNIWLGRRIKEPNSYKSEFNVNSSSMAVKLTWRVYDGWLYIFRTLLTFMVDCDFRKLLTLMIDTYLKKWKWFLESDDIILSSG